MSKDQVDCPRCFQACGWCGDYRHHHGTMNLPGIKRKCGVREMSPDAVCLTCGSDGTGPRKVWRTVTYEAISGDNTNV